MTHKPTPQQQAVIDKIVCGESNLIVEALAGCAKSTTLVMAAIAAKNARIRILSFNKSIATDMDTLIKEANIFHRVEALTCHSAGFAALRERQRYIKVHGRKLHFLLKDLYEDNENYNNINENAYTIVNLVSLAKQFMIRPEDPEETWLNLIEHFGIEPTNLSIEDLVEVSRALLLTSISQSNRIIDYDDMIYMPLLGELKFPQVDIIMKDEEQDTNEARRLLTFAHMGRLLAVGDTHQAIYAWAGADNKAIKNTIERTGAEVLPLTTTFRCPILAVEMAQKIVPSYEAFPSNRTGSIRHIGKDELLREPSLEGDCAILCRNRAPLVDLAFRFLKSGKKCKIEGGLLSNELKYLALKFGKKLSLPELVQKLKEYKEQQTSLWLEKGREEIVDKIEDKVDTVLEICQGLIEAHKTQMSDLLDWIKKFTEENENGGPIVKLSTIHRAKGREWERVYLLGYSELIPNRWATKDWQLEQEENLKYVALTRTKDELVFVELR